MIEIKVSVPDGDSCYSPNDNFEDCVYRFGSMCTIFKQCVVTGEKCEKCKGAEIKE